MTRQKTAQLIKDVSHDFQGKALLFELSGYITFRNDKNKKENTPFVIVSQVKNTRWCPDGETYIFPADSKGKVLSWRELQGSTRGEVTPEKVLFELGNFHVDKSKSKH
jgi:hypothetical protein